MRPEGLDEDLWLKVRPELDEKERLVWTARPDAMRVALRNQLRVLLGLVLSIGAMLAIKSSGANPESLTVFGPLSVLGIYLIWTAIQVFGEAGRTFYALSAERLLIFTTGKTLGVESIAPSEIAALSRSAEKDGCGDLVFERTRFRDGGGKPRRAKVRLMAIPDVAEIEALMRATLGIPGA